MVLKKENLLKSNYFQNQQAELFKILECSDLDEGEIQYRKNRLYAVIDIIQKCNDEEFEDKCGAFFQLAHEIESIPYLQSFGKLKIAQDNKNKPGADFILNDEIYIECICSSLGDKNDPLRDYIRKEGLIDYAEKKNLLNTRLINSLYTKVGFYNSHIGDDSQGRKGSIDKEKPYIIFLSPGRLIFEWFEGENGDSLLDILFGVGQPVITINTETGEIISSGYSYIETFKKYNGAKITSNLFCDEKFSCVSAVLLTTVVGERYSPDNTYLYLNPHAKVDINPQIFKDILYWNADGENYLLFKNGKEIKENNVNDNWL